MECQTSDSRKPGSDYDICRVQARPGRTMCKQNRLLEELDAHLVTELSKHRDFMRSNMEPIKMPACRGDVQYSTRPGAGKFRDTLKWPLLGPVAKVHIWEG